MAQPDMHEHQLGQFQIKDAPNTEIESAAEAAGMAAYREGLADTLAELAKGGDRAADLMADYDCCSSHEDMPSAYDVLAELARHHAAGSIDAGLAKLARYLDAVARCEAESIACHAEAVAWKEAAWPGADGD